MRFEPINNHVYLQEEGEQVTKSGIVLSEEKKNGIFKVYAIGENEFGLKAGDRVRASKFAGEDVEIRQDGKTLLLKDVLLDTLSAIVHD